MQLALPWPPSMNAYWRTWRGKMLLSEQGRAYRMAVAVEVVLARYPRVEGRLAMRVDVFAPDKRARDLDNLLKGVLDSLQKAGVYENDSQIDDLRVVRGAISPGKGRIVVSIVSIDKRS